MNTGEFVLVGLTAFAGEFRVAAFTQGASEHGSGASEAHQALLGILLGLASADDADDFIDIRHGDQQAFDDMFSASGSIEQELRASANNGNAMSQEFLQEFFEVEFTRFAIDQCQEDHRERVLQWRELVELIENNFGIVSLFDFDDQANGFFQIAFIANTRDAFDAIFADQLRDAFDDAITELLERNFRHDDARLAFVFLNFGASSNDDGATSGHVGLANTSTSTNDAPCWEVRAWNDIH